MENNKATKTQAMVHKTINLKWTNSIITDMNKNTLTFIVKIESNSSGIFGGPPENNELALELYTRENEVILNLYSDSIKKTFPHAEFNFAEIQEGSREFACSIPMDVDEMARQYLNKQNKGTVRDITTEFMELIKRDKTEDVCKQNELGNGGLSKSA